MNKNAILQLLNNESDLYVKELLPYLKGNKYTYYNLDNSEIETFKRTYTKCKRAEGKKINSLHRIFIKSIINNDKLVLPFLYKIKIMDIVLS